MDAKQAKMESVTKSQGDRSSVTVPSEPGSIPNRGHAVVIGKLPGLGHYVGSSDETSDSNSDASDDNVDLFRKKVVVQEN